MAASKHVQSYTHICTMQSRLAQARPNYIILWYRTENDLGNFQVQKGLIITLYA